MFIFKLTFWLAIIAQITIRAPFVQQKKKEPKSENKVGSQEKMILIMLSVSGFLTPLLYSVTSWLDFANYSLPGWAGWFGVALMIVALWIFWRGHYDLGLNWSPTLEIRSEHKLITNGIYGYIRHPMYASQWVWVIAQSLLLQNWLAGFLSVVVWTVFYFLRVPPEEKMMLDTFGDEYREYMKKTGGVIPKLQ